jgi:hypothetical protein
MFLLHGLALRGFGRLVGGSNFAIQRPPVELPMRDPQRCGYPGAVISRGPGQLELLYGLLRTIERQPSPPERKTPRSDRDATKRADACLDRLQMARDLLPLGGAVVQR